jgi:hypothetical protein
MFFSVVKIENYNIILYILVFKFINNYIWHEIPSNKTEIK